LLASLFGASLVHEMGPSARKRYDIDDDMPAVAWDFSVSLIIPSDGLGLPL
jgi:hypothetical protein